MKRSTWEGQTLVYRYGCPSWADLDAEGMRQLRLAHDLRNELVAVEKRYEVMLAAIWLSFSEVAAAQVAVDVATAEVERLSAEMLAARQGARSTVPAADAKTALTAARKARAAAKAELKQVKDALKPVMKARRVELDAAKRCAQGVCTKTTCTNPGEPHPYAEWTGRGLGYGTYTRTLDQHRAAASRVLDARKRGEPTEHRFHRWQGEGTLTVQIGFGTRVRGDWWTLDDGRPAKEWLARDRRVHERVDARRRTLRLRIGRSREHGAHWLELPVVIHRPVPEEAQVRWVQVTRRTVAGAPQLSVQLTLWVPPVPDRSAGEAIDVDFSWASGGTTTGVRVARISTASGNLPPVPADIADLVTVGDWWEVWAPARWRDLLGRDDAIRADRSELLDDLRPAVVEALAADPALVEAVGVTAVQARLIKFAKYDRLARSWPAEHPLWPRIEAWRRRDRHLWQYEANERQQVIARRRDAYRKVAAWLAAAARVVAIKDVDVAEARKRPGVDGEDTYEARGSRRQIQFAAPSELRMAIENAAAQQGVRILYYGNKEGGA
jgi:hypothetical protein